MPTDETARPSAGFAPPLEARMEQAIRASFASQGFLVGMGARLAEAGAGRMVIEVPQGPGATQQQGFFHGAVMGAIGDSACGYAALSLMPIGSEVLTVEYKINFLRPASGRLLRAVGIVIKPGRTLTVTQATIETDDGARGPVAIMQATMIRAPGSPAT